MAGPQPVVQFEQKLGPGGATPHHGQGPPSGVGGKEILTELFRQPLGLHLGLVDHPGVLGTGQADRAGATGDNQMVERQALPGRVPENDPPLPAPLGQPVLLQGQFQAAEGKAMAAGQFLVGGQQILQRGIDTVMQPHPVQKGCPSVQQGHPHPAPDQSGGGSQPGIAPADNHRIQGHQRPPPRG